MTDERLQDMALSMYVGEPCRICGKLITADEVMSCVFAGYSKCSTSRTAHAQCWSAMPAPGEWAYPDDGVQPDAVAGAP